ncbi:MAG: DegT/DnrJ/EryC1/StrS family aminotransferase [Candidatus Kapaibacterium sp.]
MKIPIAKTEFTEQDLISVRKVLESGWVVQGPVVKEFEDIWCKFTGSHYSVAVSSCTTALHLALIAADIKLGDEVILPSFTWVATVNAVEYVGAKPVFCDIDLSTFNIDVSKINNLITVNTKAIIPVHLFGLAADMSSVLKISNKYGLKVIEDSACGFGAYYKDVHTGNFGDFGCFSFHPRKAITTGEGGMLTINKQESAELLRSLRDHGSSISDLQRHEGNKPYLLPEFKHLGYNYRMTDIQASLGLSQMQRADSICNRRREIAGIYSDLLKGIDWLILPSYSKDYKHGFQSYVCLFRPEYINETNIQKINKQRNNFMEYLFNNGISTRPGTHAVHMLDYYKNKYKLEKTELMNSYIADSCSVTLPLYQGIKSEEIEFITNKIKAYKL